MSRMKILLIVAFSVSIIIFLYFKIQHKFDPSISLNENIIYSLVIDKSINQVIDADLRKSKVIVINQSLPSSLYHEYRISPDLLIDPSVKLKCYYYANKFISIERFISESDLKNIRFKMPLLSSETANDYKANNIEKFEIKYKLSCAVKYEYSTMEEINGVFKNEMGWAGLKKAFPGLIGYFAFSKVGFNKEKTEALIYTEFWCGNQCGEGAYWLLKRKNNNWFVEQKVGTWIS
jgi:hypothetical protein